MAPEFNIATTGVKYLGLLRSRLAQNVQFDTLLTWVG